VRVEGGFALAPKSEAQLAAEAKAAQRLAQPKASEKGKPIPAHAFIAAEGGLKREEMADTGFDRNVRVGNRTLFAAKGKGMSIAQAAELLQQHGYMPETDSNAAYELIQRSVTHPQYSLEGWQRWLKPSSTRASRTTLAAQHDIEHDLVPLAEEYLKDTGADALTSEQHDQLRALIAAAEAEGIDHEAIT
jgi:hypothetical protein